MTHQLRAMKTATESLFRHQQASMHHLVIEETRLRGLLEELKAAGCEAPANDIAFHAIGGDMAWENWVARRRENLMLDLARLLARKQAVIAALRRAHGRNEAAAALLRREMSTRTADHKKKAMQNLLDQSLWSGGTFRR